MVELSSVRWVIYQLIDGKQE